MSLCWIWLICFISLFHSNISVTYKGSRTIYTETLLATSCTDYIRTTFTFDDASDEVEIEIFSSTNTKWFAIGFPDQNDYYDKTKRKNSIMSGYAIAWMGTSDVKEYTISTSGSNLIDSMTLQTVQNINVTNVDPSGAGGTVTINLKRKLISTDATNDFEFKFAEYKTCIPILLTVAIGNVGTTFIADDNSHGSSYVYIYNINDELDTTTYVVTWERDFSYTAIDNTAGRPFNITFEMDIINQQVDITVQDGPANVGEEENNARSWGLSFPDLADTNFYSNSDPINMEAGYAILWGKTTTSLWFPHYYGGWPPGDAIYPKITEARLPKDGAACAAVTPINNKGSVASPGEGDPHTNCWDELPTSSVSNEIYTNIGGVETFTFTIPFQACGYEFNPYEYKLCRPFTLVSAAVNDYIYGLQTFVDYVRGSPAIYHMWNKIQYWNGGTRAPTNAPSVAPTLAPTYTPSTAPSNAPTQPPSSAPSQIPTSPPSLAPSGIPTSPPSTAPSNAPSKSPTFAPVNPTISPTKPTNAPTTAPSATPTAKPTDLPTVNVSTIDYPPCPGLWIKHLDELFPIAQAIEEFNEQPQIYNRRRTYTNGKGLSVHFEDRFEDGGDWIITNGSYTAISINDANFNNSLVYNTSDPNIVPPISLPGPYPKGYVYYDHFPHDNILHKPTQEVTLYFECFTTKYPTGEPSPSPTTAEPSAIPTTAIPTIAPTANCTGFCITTVWNNFDFGCDDIIKNLFKGCALKKEDIDFHANWIGVSDIEGYTIQWSPIHKQWVIDGHDGYSAAAITGTSKYPPQFEIWNVFPQENPFVRPCQIRIWYTCSWSGIPTEAPTRSPTTAQPTTKEPTGNPTSTPSNAPTNAPSNAPSISPTKAPTGNPITECLGVYLNGTDYLNGLYARQPNVDVITGKHYWHKLKGDGEIFWSSSSLHESWIIHSEKESRYWLSTTKPFYQPALITIWQLYLGASPFIESTRELTLECFDTLPPTAEPTFSPSQTPSSAPTNAPSLAPTQPPTSEPTNAPSTSPTSKPTTESPTNYPTKDPTYDPTVEPTAEPCDFLIMTNPLSAAELIPWVGVYLYTSDDWSKEWTKKDSYNFYLQNLGGTDWSISTNMAQLKLISEGRPQRPPFHNYWNFQTTDTPPITFPTNYTINIECSTTNVPTNSPTNAPSLAPSMSPTSSCQGLYFNNTNIMNYTYNGWYARQNDYLINNHRHWINQENTATIAHIHGHWYLSQKDNNIIDDEDPIMLNNDPIGDISLSPPSGIWYYADESPDDYNSPYANITIQCSATRKPSQEPTYKPSNAPTEYIPLEWEFCPGDVHKYFTFITNITSAVYWPLPIVKSHLYNINISVTPQGTEPGDDIEQTGKYDILYTATDNSGFDGRNSIECTITIYVIGNIDYRNTYEYCKRSRFWIELQFNDTYYKLGKDKEEVEGDDDDDDNNNNSGEKIEGFVYDPMLQHDETNCYVTAQQIRNYDTIVIEDEPGKSTFLGMEAVNLVWEILVLLLILILMCLIIDCLYRIYKDRKNKQMKKDEQQQLLLQEQQQLSEEDNNDNKPKDEEKGNDENVNTSAIEMQQRQRVNTGDDD